MTEGERYWVRARELGEALERAERAETAVRRAGKGVLELRAERDRYEAALREAFYIAQIRFADVGDMALGMHQIDAIARAALGEPND
jgi:hypothetical protein